MDYQQIWDLMRENALHISVLNDELGQVIAQMAAIVAEIGVITGLVWWILGIITISFVALVTGLGFMLKQSIKRSE